MYYCITLLKHPNYDYKLVVLKSRRPRKRIPKWIYVLKRARKTYLVYEFYKITKLSRSAKEYLNNYMNKWLPEHEFRDIMITAIRMSYKREETINKYIKNLEEFIKMDIPKVEVVRRKLEIKCPTMLDWLPPSFVEMWGKPILRVSGVSTRLYEYSKTYHIYIYDIYRYPDIMKTIIIPKECSEFNMDAVTKLSELPDSLLKDLIRQLKDIINRMNHKRHETLIDVANKLIMMIKLIMN